MRKRRFSEQQIVKILGEAKAGKSVKDICRKHGISDATFYTWRKKYGGMTAPDVKRLRELERENARLKHLLADSMLENRAIKA